MEARLRYMQLAVGWLALCSLTAAAAYYGAIEFNLQVHLSAIVPPRGNTGTAGGSPPVVTPPSPNPVVLPPVKKDPDPIAKQPDPPLPSPAPQPAPPVKTTPDPAPIARDQVDPRPIPPPRQVFPPAADLSSLQAQLDDVTREAQSLIGFFNDMERSIPGGLRSEIRMARSRLISSVQTARVALTRRDAAAATAALAHAQEQIEILHEQKGQ